MIFEDPEDYYQDVGRFISVDIVQSPTMGMEEFSHLNYSERKAYNLKGLNMQVICKCIEGSHEEATRKGFQTATLVKVLLLPTTLPPPADGKCFPCHRAGSCPE